MTPGRLQRAGAANHRSFFAAAAIAAGGTASDRYGGTVANQPAGDLMVAFPRVPIAEVAAFADEVVQLARQDPRASQVGWWTLDEPDVPGLGARLLARGFHWGWRPNWMALDQANLVPDHPVPQGLSIRPVDSGFEAWLAGSRVGQIAFHRSEYAGRPVGGIYDTGVEPEARRQGIGTALTVAAGRLAGALGCRHVLLNATGEGQPVYARAGFDQLGEAGQTWWLPKETIEAAPPSRPTVELAEAIGTGDLDTAAAALRADERDLDATLPCDLTPLGIATRLDRPDSARWLVDHGATLEVTTAWSLGWRDEAAKLLAENPALARRQSGSWQLSPLHVAAYRGDIELARLILAAGPDPTAADSVLHKDPVEWAHLHGHRDVAQLIADWRSAEG